MNWRLFFIGIIGIALGMLFGQTAWSYSEIQVTNGGTIQGKVTIEGGKPRPMAFNLVTIPDPVFCGTISTGTGWRLLEDFIIGPDKGLKDVVVMLKDVKKGKAFTIPKVRIESIDCDFIPFMNVIKDKDEIEVVNMDPVEHDIQGYETARERGARVLFNRPLPMNPFLELAGVFGKKYMAGKPMVEKIHLRKGRNLFVMQCGFHPYMFAWGLVAENPYFFITKEDGKFHITDIPPGEYVLAAWHPGMKKFIEQPVTVKAHASTGVNFVYQSPQGRRSAHEIEKNPRFGLELLKEGEVI
ncbi:MAG: carboxypeptidase-like regulatory domain-containing protein, partial [Nitrospirota bacterium]|nr:carboxypeptidase-like regulatory domain-containing protein [Nitrospirota bacterium]MDX2419517.1 carboxypeptidase-like regulatory domain-containing protein [Nitrospirota bacterium]